MHACSRVAFLFTCCILFPCLHVQASPFFNFIRRIVISRRRKRTALQPWSRDQCSCRQVDTTSRLLLHYIVIVSARWVCTSLPTDWFESTGKRIIMIGDSNMRFQYLNLAYYLCSGVRLACFLTAFLSFYLYLETILLMFIYHSLVHSSHPPLTFVQTIRGSWITG